MAKSRARRNPTKTVRRWRLKAIFWINVLLVLAIGGWYVVQPPPRQLEVRRLVTNAFKEKKNVSAWDVAWDLYQLYYSPDFVVVRPPDGDLTYAFAGLPRDPDREPLRLLLNKGYAVGYSEARADPLWSAYRIVDVDTIPAAEERPSGFAVDSRTVARVRHDDYTGSGFDRGHLAPNYAIATRYGREAQEETFLMSNIIPQKHALNAGVWKDLEMKIATNYPARFGEVWVVAGPIFGAKPTRLGRDGPTVPEACYMIIIDESNGRVRTQAFIFPTETGSGTNPTDYLVSIDTIEARTGLDFLTALDDSAEDQLEARPAERVW